MRATFAARGLLDYSAYQPTPTTKAHERRKACPLPAGPEQRPEGPPNARA